MKRRTLLATWVLVCWAASVSGQGLPKSRRPDDVWLFIRTACSHQQVLSSEIDKKAIPGAILLVTREGKSVYFQASVIRTGRRTSP